MSAAVLCIVQGCRNPPTQSNGKCHVHQGPAPQASASKTPAKTQAAGNSKGAMNAPKGKGNSSASSTTASGHVGTGIGYHDKSWPHYKPPDKNNLRAVHTMFDFADADSKIKNASKTTGYVWVKATVGKKSVVWTCNACKTTKVGNPRIKDSMPSLEGCKGGKNHIWIKSMGWATRSTTSKLYYNKSGSVIEVSYHAF